MRFNVLSRLRAVEKIIDAEMLAASKELAGEHRPKHLLLAFLQARKSDSPAWEKFVAFARPLIEARNHIQAERERITRAPLMGLAAAVDRAKRRRAAVR